MKTSTKYDRFSKIYDLAESYMEKEFFSKWRKMVWKMVQPNSKILEVGIGTGKNIPYYPDTVEVIGVDFSQGMLDKALRRSNKYQNKKIRFVKMDVAHLGFPENSFDFVVSTFVFCTVPDPIAGLKEVKRVLKPNGQAIFLEHMRSSKWFNNVPLYMMNPVIKALVGTSVIRKTKENILEVGFRVVKERNLFSDIVKLLICRKN